jgi:rhodanese-related sulfurtransferase
MMRSYRNHPANDYVSVVDDETQFIDVRQPAEVAERGIAAARNIPLDQLVGRVAELDPHRRTVVLCRSGGRSAQAADYLAGVGFVDVVNLTGGILELTEGAQR